MAPTSYLHPHLGFTLTLPSGWRVAGEVPPIFVAPRADARAFAGNVCITSEAVPEDTGARDWTEEALGAARLALGPARLLDSRPVDAPAGALRTLVHHAAHGTPVVLEQWWVVVDRRGWVISASCSPTDYDELADDMDALAQSFATPQGPG